MSIQKTEQEPDDPEQLPPARRRRSKRLLLPKDVDEQSKNLGVLAHRTSPSFDFFLFTIFSAAIISAGLLFNAPALIVLGAIVAPLMAPVVGISLGTVTGSVRFFLRSLISTLIAGGLVFLIGFLAGTSINIFPSLSFEQATYHTQLTWYGFLVLAFGSILTAATLVNSEKNAALPSVALAYQLIVPLTTAGIGFGGKINHLWPDGLVVFLIYLAWAALLGALTLAIKGLRPLTLFGYTLGGVFSLIGITLIIGLGGFGTAIESRIALPTLIPTITPSPTFTITPPPTNTQTFTPIPPTKTTTPTISPSKTPTPTNTPSPSPTPVYAIIDASNSGGEGARIRSESSFNAETLAILRNGTMIQILSDTPVEQEHASWVYVIAPDGTEGWMVQALLVVATPAPNW